MDEDIREIRLEIKSYHILEVGENDMTVAFMYWDNSQRIMVMPINQLQALRLLLGKPARKN